MKSPLLAGASPPTPLADEDYSSEDESAVEENAQATHARLKALLVSGDVDGLTGGKSGYMHKKNRRNAWCPEPIKFTLEGTQLVYNKPSGIKRVDLCSGTKGCAVEHMAPIAHPPGNFASAFGFTLSNL